MPGKAPRPTSSEHDPPSYSRRQFLVASGKAGLAGAAATALPVRLLAPEAAAAATTRVLSSKERRTLRAAVARIVPAEGPGDWSAADVDADQYILTLLAGPGRVYAGGPTRRRFPRFQR